MTVKKGGWHLPPCFLVKRQKVKPNDTKMKLDAVLDKKVRRLVLLCAAVATGFTMIGAWLYQPRPQPALAAAEWTLRPGDANLTADGQILYATHCASCHGVRLEGQPQWRVRLANGLLPAPPHDASGHTWHHGDSYLFAVTKYGIERLLGQHYPNAMPIYDGVLSDREIIAVLSYIKSQWPAEIQSRHDRLNQQLRRQNN